jgi:hypothetical protein
MLVPITYPQPICLLSLQVASEDTVLYTAQRYVNNTKGTQKELARQQLAPLIRCPRLSRYWQSASVNSTKAGDTYMLLAELRPLLQRLLLVLDGQSDYTVLGKDLKKGGVFEGAPSSWVLGRRARKKVRSVQLVWQLDVGELRQAAQRSASEQAKVMLRSPCASPPLGGVCFGAMLSCRPWKGGAYLDLSVGPRFLPADMCLRFDVKLAVEGFKSKHQRVIWLSNRVEIFSNFFRVGAMPGGWDERAWAAKGLPSRGHITIKAKVRELAHAPNSCLPTLPPFDLDQMPELM